MHDADPSKPATGFQNCPVLGVGLGLRRQMFEAIMAHDRLQQAEPATIDWLEFTPENYMRRGGRHRHILEAASQRYPMVSHSVSLSIGSTDPWNEDYLRDLEALFELTNPPWFSDHICFSSAEGVYFNDLIPLPRTQEAVAHMTARIRYLQDRFQRPVLVENISQYFNHADDAMTDAEFITAISEQADCGLLLDINNVYVNAQNSPERWPADIRQYLRALPLHRVVQIHVAGHHQGAQCVIDTHGAPVCDPVWELLAWVMAQPACRPCGVMLERDNEIPPFADLMPELEKIREIWISTGQPILHRETSYVS